MSTRLQQSDRNSYLATPGATLEVLQRWDLHTKKSLGQHFLVDDAVVGKILQLADVQQGDSILEVGPGIGTLTVALLAQGAEVIAIERDSDLLPVLMDDADAVIMGDGDLLNVLHMDALDLQPQQLISEASALRHGQAPTKFVANLPYAVAATLVLDYLQRIPSIQTVCVMVQQEVAQRMCAKPGTKDYAAYSVKVQLLAQPDDSFTVKPGSFFPPPRVDSKVIRLDRRESTEEPEVIQAACLMADAAFYQRRKTIRNSMTSYFKQHAGSAELVDEVLQQAGVDSRSRGEVHTLDTFLQMGRAYLQIARS